jgi:hypothetical protein
MTYEQLGKAMLDKVGEEACLEGYGTADPYWVGVYAREYNDINPDGTLN